MVIQFLLRNRNLYILYVNLNDSRHNLESGYKPYSYCIDCLSSQPTLSRFFNRLDKDTLRQFDDTDKDLRDIIHSAKRPAHMLLDPDRTLFKAHSKLFLCHLLKTEFFHSLPLFRIKMKIYQEGKSRFDFASVNSHSKAVNTNRMRIHMRAYNLFNWFRRLVLPAKATG